MVLNPNLNCIIDWSSWVIKMNHDNSGGIQPKKKNPQALRFASKTRFSQKKIKT
jgi:hypothetical protein